MSDSTPTTWAPQSVNLGMDQWAPGITGSARHLALRLGSDRPVPGQLDAMQVELFKNVQARVSNDRAVAAWRRLRAEVAAADAKRVEAEAHLSDRLAKRDRLLEELPDGLSELLVAADGEVRQAETDVATAKEGARLLARPLALAAEAAKTAVMSAAQSATRDIEAGLKLRRDDLANRLGKHAGELLDGLSVVEQQLTALTESHTPAGTANVFLRQV